MSSLLEALQAASKVGFEAPRCAECRGHREHRSIAGNSWGCSACHATGLDASDPERLIGRAMVWLLTRNHDPAIHAYPKSVRFVNYTEAVDMMELDRSHDGTPASLAAALLRLVARVGGAA